jgi:hypothetical protein
MLGAPRSPRGRPQGESSAMRLVAASSSCAACLFDDPA